MKLPTQKELMEKDMIERSEQTSENSTSVDPIVIQSFESQEDATEWMHTQVNDPYIDNDRFAFADDTKANEEYEKAVKNGCCGFFDAVIFVNGKEARIGCNFGH